MNIHISGASGFVGTALVKSLYKQGVSVSPWVRQPMGLKNEVIVSDLSDLERVDAVLRNCEVFVHLAAKVHQFKPSPTSCIDQYRNVNVELTLRLAKSCINAGVKRFIFVSSVKVNGEITDQPLNEGDIPNASDPYGRSKLEAELGLLDLARSSGILVTIIRPPLVYGPGVGANFQSLLKWLYWSLPVPFALIENKRSLVYVGNLVSAISCSIYSVTHESGVYFLSDGHDLSSNELCFRLSRLLNVSNLSISVPKSILVSIGLIIGKKPQMNRLLGSLQVDSSLFCKQFNWTPPYTLDQGLSDTANWFLNLQQTKRFNLIKRVLDLLISVALAVILLIPFFFVALLVKVTSQGPILYWSQRIGLNNKVFMMPKFRSMKVGAPVVATHLLRNPDDHLTPIGRFLRISSLDELPQLFCVFLGQMSLVGPRPALFNQYDLIALRTEANVHQLLPGVTGWAQVNGRDELDLTHKVEFDKEYLENKSILFDLKVLVLTVFKVLGRKNITH